MDSPARTAHPWRFVAGAVIATAAALTTSHLLLLGELDEVAASRDRRLGVVSLNALTGLVQAAGDDGDALRKMVPGLTERLGPGTEVRVLRFAGAALEASTAAADTGELAAPRRLSRDEKPFYDKGQRLRAAVETNRDEGSARKDEIEVENTTLGGGYILAGPLEDDGDVTGMVELTVVRPPPGPAPGPWWAVLLGLAAVAVVTVAAVLARQRALTTSTRTLQVVLAVTGAAAIIAALAGHAAYAASTLTDARREASAEVSAHAIRLGQQVVELATLSGQAPPVPAPGTWDTDAFRRPRGELAPEGAVVSPPPAAPVLPAALVLLLALAVAVYLLTGLSVFHRLSRTVITNRTAYGYITPAMVGMVLLVFFPFLYGITLSFTDANLYNASRPLSELWVGLTNYADILFSFEVLTRSAEGGLVVNYQNFYWTLLFTIIWTVTNVTIGVSVGLALALALNIKGLWFRPVYRVLLILPWAVPNYITALIWKGMFHRQFGVINHLIQLFGGQPLSWFDAPLSSFATALATNGWLSFPFMMVVSLGALQSIPDELYEAAEVDGASRWQQFRAITLPALRPALVPAVILSVVWTFNMFNIIYLVTGGEPGGATEILVTQAYKFAFERYRYGYAAAYSTVIFLILLAYGVFQNRVSRATEA